MNAKLVCDHLDTLHYYCRRSCYRSKGASAIIEFPLPNPKKYNIYDSIGSDTSIARKKTQLTINTYSIITVVIIIVVVKLFTETQMALEL